MFIPDEILWEKIVKGDDKAWTAMIHRYQALVYAVVSRAGLSMTDAADCFQQTWVALYQNRRRIQDPSRISAWLVTTAKREVLRAVRQTRSDIDSENLNGIKSEALLPDEEMEKLESQAQLEAGLKELDPRCREILYAFFFDAEDRSYDEIAQKLGLAPNSLGPFRRRCLDKLKSILTK
jgi:RNA polymerase sigma factor (sigma-70 family)